MYNDLQLRAFTQIAYIDLESKYNLLLNANHDLKTGIYTSTIIKIFKVPHMKFQSAKMTLLKRKWHFGIIS